MQERMTGQEIEENTLVNRWVNEYMKEKEKREQLEKEYKLLNEKYEQALNDYDDLLQSHPYCSNWHNSCESINNSNCYFKQLARKTQECEELKERLVRTEEDLKYQCVDCMNVKSDSYRKALEEIKEIAEQFCNACQEFEPEKKGSNCMYCNYDKILDIINKAKGR